MGKGPHALPRRPPIKERSRFNDPKGPSFDDPDYAPKKQEMREVTADFFARYIPVAEPYVFVMPYYWALCAKTIQARIPGAIFRAVDKYSHVKENVAEVGGEKIRCYSMTVKRYIERDPDRGLRFHGAFLDYFDGGPMAPRNDEIVAFVREKMQPNGVLAVTMQCPPDTMQALERQLQAWSATVKMAFCEAYRTRADMCHAVFLLDASEREPVQ